MTTVIALALVLASAQDPLVRPSQGTLVAIPSASAVKAHFPFDTPGCFASGAMVGRKGGTLSVSRAEGRYCPSAVPWQTCAVNEVCVASDGAAVERARTNLLLEPATLTSTIWSGTGGALSASGTGPDGLTAYAFTENALTSGHRFQQINVNVTSGTTYQRALYVKPSGRTIVRLADASWEHWARFSLSGNGVAVPGGTGTTAGVAALSDGWYLVWMGAAATATAANRFQLDFCINTAGCDASGEHSYGGSGAVAGYVSDAVLEAGSYPNFFGVGARNHDTITYTSGIPAGSSWCRGGTYTPGRRAWNQTESVYKMLFTVGTYGNASSAGGFVNVTDGTTYFGVYDVASNVRAVQDTTNIGWGTSTSHTVAFCNENGTLRMYRDGVPLGYRVAAATGTGLGGYTGTVTIGNAFGGWVKNYRECATSDPNARGCGLGARPDGASLLIATLGDSITRGAGVTTPYPSTLATSLGSPWTAGNYGVSGNRTDEALARWTSDVQYFGASAVVVLAGINDALQDKTAAEAYGNLETLYTAVRAAGLRLVPVTILPWRTASGYTAGRETVRTTINTSILAYCTANGITCVDASTDFDDGTGLMKAAYDSGDHLHPNQAGMDRLAALVRAAFP